MPRDYGEMQDDEAIWRQERAGFIAILSLRMLRFEITIIQQQLIFFQTIHLYFVFR